MKLVTWNCAMALQKKIDPLLSLNADVMVIQECSRKSIEQISAKSDFTAGWFGNNKNKGLAVICKSPWKISTSKDCGITWAANIKIVGPIGV